MAKVSSDGAIILTTKIDQEGLKNGMASMKNGAKSLVSSFKKLATVIGIAFSVKALISFSNEASKMATNTEASVQRIIDIYGKSGQAVGDFIDENANAIGMSKAVAAQFASVYGNLFSVWADQATNAQLTNQYLNMTAVVASKTGRTMEDVQERIRSGLLGNTEAVEDLGVFVNVKTIEMTEAFQSLANGRSWEQLNAYEQSQVRTLAILEQATNKYGNTVAQSNALTRAQYNAAFEDFKNTWGTVINSILMPILRVLTKVFQYATMALQALFKISGKTINVDASAFNEQEQAIGGAVDNQNDLTDAVKGTAKEQKKLLAGFDDLQIISQSAAGSGTGAASETPSGGGAITAPPLSFEETDSTDIQNGIDGLIADIKLAWEQGDFTSIGTTVGTKISTALNSIEWTNIQGVANNFASSTATFFNGAITPTTFSSLGTTIGNALNTALYAALTFLQTFDYYNFGASIATGLSTAIQTIDWSSFGTFFSTGLSNALLSVAGFLANFDISTIFNALLQFLSGIDWQQIANSVGIFLQSVDWGTVLETLIIIGIGTLIKIKITTLFTTVIQPALKTQLTNLTNYIQGLNIGGVLLGALGLVVLTEGLQDMFKNGPNWQNILTVLAGAIMVVVGAIWAFNAALLANPITWIIVGIMALIAAIALVVVYWDEIKAAFATAGQWFYDNVISPVTNFFSEMWTNVSGFFSNLWDDIVAIWVGVSTWFDENVIQPVADFFSGLWDKIKNAFSSVGEFFGGIGDKIKEAFKEAINGLLGIVEKGLNWLIGKINLISFDVPDWVPGIGGKKLGFNIPEIKIPRLAQGAVIPPNREFMAVLGDQKHGVNIETPLQTMIDAFNAALDNRNDGSGGSTTVILEIDGREFGRAVVEQGDKEKRRIGTRLVMA